MKDGAEKATAVTQEELSRISQLVTPNQALAVIRQAPNTPPAASGFHIYLDRIQDPGNLGTIIRIADWFGAAAVVCSEGSAELYNPKVVQSTMASIARVPVYYDKSYQWLSEQTTVKYAAVLNGTPVQEINAAANGILLIGNESKGLSDEVLAMATQKITISKKGEAESLNAAVATGILLSHLIK
jgi:TrmH family RNA methyltransferase